MSLGTNITVDLKEHHLENGLRLIMNEDHSSPIISFQVWYHVGSLYEREGKTGISHLFEHMMFKGSNSIGPEEHSRIVYKHGGTDNAFTSKDCTAYFENLPASQLELAARLEADRMVNLRLTPKTLGSEREVVKEERRLRVDNSLFGRLNEELYATAFVEHPYRWPVIGLMSDLEAISLDDCISFYKTYYSPNNATILVTGDIDCKRTISVIEHYFGILQPGTIFEEVIPPEPQQMEERQKEISVEAQFPWLAVAYHIPDAINDDIPVIEMLGNILTVGRSSRLYQKIVCEESSALSIFSSVDRNRYPGVFSITAGNIREGNSPSSIDTIITEYLNKLKEELVTVRELEKARNKIETALIFGLQTNFARALRIGLSLERRGEPLGFLRDLERYSQVTAEDVQRVARRYLRAENRTVIHLLPKKRRQVISRV